MNNQLTLGITKIGDLLLKKGTVRDCPYCGSFIDEKGLIKR